MQLKFRYVPGGVFGESEGKDTAGFILKLDAMTGMESTEGDHASTHNHQTCRRSLHRISFHDDSKL
jgi:hypothetical protein